MPKDYRFSIAISFAGDNKRDRVRQVAEILRNRVGDGRVFFDEWFEAELAGHDANTVLQNIYQKSSRLVVSCVCKRYNEKPWTQDEWRAIQSFERTLRDAGTDNIKRMRFLPLRFGDGEVDGLFDTALIPDVRKRSPEDIAALILQRLKLSDADNSEDDLSKKALKIQEYDLILACTSADLNWARALSSRLYETHSFSVALDQWDVAPETTLQQFSKIDLNQGGCLAICVSEETNRDWLEERIEQALEHQAKEILFGIVPVLLPKLKSNPIENISTLRTFSDFRNGEDQDLAFHILSQGVKRMPVGAWPITENSKYETQPLSIHEIKMLELQRFRRLGVNENLILKFEDRVLEEWLKESGKYK